MSGNNISGIGGAGNTQWSRQLAEQLDAADGKKDGKISANNWNVFLKAMGSSGNKISNYITVDNAVRSFNFYEKKKDVNTNTEWNKWEDKFNEAKDNFKEGGIRESAPAQNKSGVKKTENKNKSGGYTPVVGAKSRYHKGFTIVKVNKDGTFVEQQDNNPNKTMLCNPDGSVKRVDIKNKDGSFKWTTYENGKPYKTCAFDKSGRQRSGRWHQDGETAILKPLPNGTRIRVDHFDDGSPNQYYAYNPKTNKWDIPCDKNGKPIK